MTLRDFYSQIIISTLDEVLYLYPNGPPHQLFELQIRKDFTQSGTNDDYNNYKNKKNKITDNQTS